MQLLFYRIFLLLFNLAIRLAALYSSKARNWVSGRKMIFSRLRHALKHNEKIIWMHCASLGEFEQGRPVLERIKELYPGYRILLTFFSPSGYEIRKNYDKADHVFYLPADSPAHAKEFLEIVKPSLVIFVKYEFWFYYLDRIHRQKIPLILISAVFRENHIFFKGYGALYRRMLNYFSFVFVQDGLSAKLIAGLMDTKKILAAGDTRFDRVIEIAQKFEPVPGIENFCAGCKVIVAGSTWSGDEKALQEVFTTLEDPLVRLIIAPHETDKEHLAELRGRFPAAVFYSEWIAANTPATAQRVLIIDGIGLLSRLYHYAYLAYIGGGFTKDGIHNTLEAAVYGKPLVFGPQYKKYREAVELIEADAAKSFATAATLKQILSELLYDRDDHSRRGNAAKNYVKGHQGATEKIVRYIQENRLLTR